MTDSQLSMPQRPVLIVGAGPVGLVAACELARRGVPVRIVDRLAEPSNLSKAVAVHARTIEALSALGIADSFLEAGVRSRGASLAIDGRVVAEIDFDGLETAFPFALCLPQDATEQILGDRLAAAGTTIERGVAVSQLEQDADGGTATLVHTEGAVEKAGFSFAVGCDGASSTVRKLVGTKLEGSFKGTWFILADCDAALDLPRERIHLVFHADGVLGYFPLPGKRCRLVIQLAEPPAAGAQPTLDETQALADARTGGTLRLSDPRWLSYFEVHHGQVPSYRSGRVFLAGDAAHIHSPAGGQGMNTGIQDAVNLAWKLHLAWAGHASPGLLDSYHAERHPVGAHVIALTRSMTTAMTAGGRVARRSRELLFPVIAGHLGIAGRIAGDLSELRIAYEDSPIVGGVARRAGLHGSLRPGDLAPDVGGLLADAFDPLVHTAVFFPGDQVARCASAAESMRRSFGPHLATLLVTQASDLDPRFDRTISDPGGALARRFGAGEGLLAVVRPDRYLAYLGEPRDLEEAERLLARTIG